jgi:hypothetical protein
MKISRDVKLFPEEPDALIGHVRVCGGSGEVTPRFYPAKGEKVEEDTRICTRKRVFGKKVAWCKAPKRSQYEASASGRRRT